MAKSTRAGGATFTQHELADPHPPFAITRAELGRVDQLAGTDYSGPLSSESQSNAPETPSPRGPVHTMESLSSQTGQGPEGSSADSTDGVGQMETTNQYDEWNECTVEELREECRERGLAVSGRKDELIARLQQNDAESSSEFE